MSKQHKVQKIGDWVVPPEYEYHAPWWEQAIYWAVFPMVAVSQWAPRWMRPH